MERVLKLAAHFRVPARVIINKADLNAEQTDRIGTIAEREGAPVIARIPFDPHVNDALMAGLTVVEYGRGPAAAAMREVWRSLKHELEKSEP
jgi:MinD superfamily P-loop ATPase